MDELTTLDDVLEREAMALRSGDYETLEEIASEKQDIVDRLSEETADLSSSDVARVQEKLRRNEVLYDATMDGLRSVIERLKSVSRVSSHLDTYTQSGFVQDLAPPRPSFEKRS